MSDDKKVKELLDEMSEVRKKLAGVSDALGFTKPAPFDPQTPVPVVEAPKPEPR